jgi:hypothetical protein
LSIECIQSAVNAALEFVEVVLDQSKEVGDVDCDRTVRRPAIPDSGTADEKEMALGVR